MKKHHTKSLEDSEGHNFVKGTNDPNSDYSYGVQTLESLKKSLIEVSKSRLVSGDKGLENEILSDIEEYQNNEMLLRYLVDSKNHKLPITFKKKLDKSLMMLSRLQSNSKQEEAIDSQSEEETYNFEQHSDSLQDEEAVSRNYNNHNKSKDKPLLSSKKKLSHLLIQDNQPNGSSKIEFEYDIYSNEGNEESKTLVNKNMDDYCGPMRESPSEI